MFLGYNTNGLAHHDLFDAVELLAEIGYRGVAITIDHNALPPVRREHCGSQRHRRGCGRLLERLGMRSVIETGARFLLDPRTKHEPTLLSDGPPAADRLLQVRHRLRRRAGERLRVALVGRAARVGESHAPNRPMRSAGRRAATKCSTMRPSGTSSIGFEPEPGMLIDSHARRSRSCCMRIDAPNLRLTLDVGHLHCQGETPIAEVIRRWAPRLVNVHHRGHAGRASRAPDVRRGRDRLPAGLAGPGRSRATPAASTWNSAATATKGRRRRDGRLSFSASAGCRGHGNADSCNSAHGSIAEDPGNDVPVSIS